METESRKLVPQFVGPFEVNQMVNPAAVCLMLPASFNIHLTFHFSWVKPVKECKLSPTAEDPSVSHPVDPSRPLMGLRLAVPPQMGGVHILDQELLQELY